MEEGLDREVEDDMDDNYRERYLDKDTDSNMVGRWTSTRRMTWAPT